MLVLDPIPVIIDNLPDDYIEEIELPFSPKDPAMGNHAAPSQRRSTSTEAISAK
jgi:glutaminyl-tRNA synthetase